MEAALGDAEVDVPRGGDLGRHRPTPHGGVERLPRAAARPRPDAILGVLDGDAGEGKEARRTWQLVERSRMRGEEQERI